MVWYGFQIPKLQQHYTSFQSKTSFFKGVLRIKPTKIQIWQTKNSSPSDSVIKLVNLLVFKKILRKISSNCFFRHLCGLISNWLKHLNMVMYCISLKLGIHFTTVVNSKVYFSKSVCLMTKTYG